MSKKVETREENSTESLSARISPELIEQAIMSIRGQRVLMDAHLADFYGIETKALTRAVRRNIERFPSDFMFQLTTKEFNHLRHQSGTSSSWGGRRYRPLFFTEQGVAMLSSVLRSTRAVEINIEIMRAFVRLRQLLSVHKELAQRLTRLEKQMKDRDQAVAHQFREVFALLEQLFNPPDRKKRPIGFLSESEDMPGKKVKKTK